jgi:hypothetical protein
LATRTMSLHSTKRLANRFARSGPQLLAAATWAGSQDAVRRWPTTLHAIDPTKVREEIYGVIRPGRIADFGSTRGRYQPLKLAVWPKRRVGKRHLHH